MIKGFCFVFTGKFLLTIEKISDIFSRVTKRQLNFYVVEIVGVTEVVDEVVGVTETAAGAIGVTGETGCGAIVLLSKFTLL